MLADVLRTDRARLRPLIPDSPATATLRQACRARQDLVRHRVAVGNQLRAHLLSVFPGAAGLFGKLHSAISLAFLARFDCQDRADWLSQKRLAAWLKAAGYSGRTSPAGRYQRLRAAPSTRQSGKHKAVTFRWAARKQLRGAVCDFADGSRHASPWAAKIYNDAIARGKDHPHAIRILARAWLYVIWNCWHNGVAYDPARHRALQRQLAQATSPQQAA